MRGVSVIQAITWLLFYCGLASTASGQSRDPQQIDVVANDYAFTPLPSRIQAGPTVFTFANNGKVQHEMSIARLSSGTTIEDLLKISKEGGRFRDVVERSVGILIAGGGKRPDGRLWVDLQPGATYVVLCNLKDRQDAPPHMSLGMYATFKPEVRR
jgi:plastocyanin